jgi:hypothetical protein
MTIGNLPRRVMNKSFAKRVECGAGYCFFVWFFLCILRTVIGVHAHSGRTLPQLEEGRVRGSEARSVSPCPRTVAQKHPHVQRRRRFPRNPSETCAILLFFLFLIFTFFPLQAGHDEPELFWPVIGVVINDNPEGQRLCGIYDHKDAKFPCRMCW